MDGQHENQTPSQQFLNQDQIDDRIVQLFDENHPILQEIEDRAFALSQARQHETAQTGIRDAAYDQILTELAERHPDVPGEVVVELLDDELMGFSDEIERLRLAEEWRQKQQEEPAQREEQEHGEELAGSPAMEPPLSTERPEIDLNNTDLFENAELAWEGIVRMNWPPRFFLSTGEVREIERTEDGIVASEISALRLLIYLSQAATWYKEDRDGNRRKGRPTQEMAKLALEFPNIPLPRLKRIINVPIFDAKGRLIQQPGFHPDSGIFFEPAKGLENLRVAARPSASQVELARRNIVEELLADFPFKSQADRANCVGMLLLPFVRDLIDGSTPLHMVGKPTRGTGATLLTDVVLRVATGRPPAVYTAPKSQDEWQKLLLAILRNASPAVVFDNLGQKLDTQHLAAALTSDSYAGRILGVTQTSNVAVRCLWVATANNPQLSTEIARRTVWIWLESGEAQPENRTPDSFRHFPLKGWVEANKPELVWSALTLAQAWIAAGRPPARQTLGSYDEWAYVVGGILDNAGIEGFSENRATYTDRADEELVLWQQITTLWWETHKGTPIGVRDLYPLLRDNQADLDLGDGSEEQKRQRLGNELKRKLDCTFGKYTIRQYQSSRGGSNMYHLERKAE